MLENKNKKENNRSSESTEGQTTERLIKQIGKGGGIAFIGKIITKIIGLTFNIIMASVLGPAMYGLYILGTTVASIFQSLASVGFKQGIVRFGAIYRGQKDEGRLKGVIISGLFLSACTSLIFAFFLFLFSGHLGEKVFKDNGLIWIFKIFALIFPFNVIVGIAGSVAQAFRKIFYRTMLQDIIHPLANILFVSIAFLLGYSLKGAVYGILFSSVVSAIIGFYVIVKVFPKILTIPQPIYEHRRILTFAFPLFLTGIASLLLTRTDCIMLGFFKVSEDVGIYGAAAKVSFLLTSFVTSLNVVFAPQISNLYNKNKLIQLEGLLKVITKWSFTLALPIFLIFIIYSSEIMRIFGRGFEAGKGALVALGFAKLAAANLGTIAIFLIMTGRQKLELINSISVAVVNIALNFLLIPVYGKLGAALATGFSFVVIGIIRLLQIYKIYKIHPFKKSFLKPIMVSILSIAGWYLFNYIISYFQYKWIIGIVLFLLFYYIFYIMLGIEKEDRVIFNSLKKKYFFRT